MILVFGDVHLGEKTYSKINSDGFYCAELEAIKALEQIYTRASQNDIQAIICTGDFFHTNHPTVKLIDYAIYWFKKMNSLNKPFVVIPGNHDASTYSHALSFLKKLNIPNIVLVDNDVTKINLDNHDCYFVPYIQDADNSAKLVTFSENFLKACEAPENSIIVSHAVESEARTGSEAYLIAKKVASLDVAKKLLVVLGHIHRQQLYTKATGATVVYTGSVSYNDLNDIGQAKGYALIDKDNSVVFEAITNIRKFLKYTVAQGVDIVSYFNSMRLVSGSVIFIYMSEDVPLPDELIELFNSKNITIGNVIVNESLADETTLLSNVDGINPLVAYQNYFADMTIDDKEAIIEYGQRVINSVITKKG